jgi:hypothetical protein
MAWRDEIDRRLQYGPGLRAQRCVEAALLLAALSTRDVRFAYAAVALTLLQAISGRFALVALVVAAFTPARAPHRMSDLYCDVEGSRGACVVASTVQVSGLALVHFGHPTPGFLLLTMPTASMLMSPTLGFCAGSWFYVLGRDLFARSAVDGARDVEVADER